jgi:hypothetical protein
MLWVIRLPSTDSLRIIADTMLLQRRIVIFSRELFVP